MATFGDTKQINGIDYTYTEIVGRAIGDGGHWLPDAANDTDIAFDLLTITPAQLTTQNAAAKVEDPELADLTAIAIAQSAKAGQPVVYVSPHPKDYEYEVYTSGATIALRPLDTDDYPKYEGANLAARPDAGDFNIDTDILWHQTDDDTVKRLTSDGLDWLDKGDWGGGSSASSGSSGSTAVNDAYEAWLVANPAGTVGEYIFSESSTTTYDNAGSF